MLSCFMIFQHTLYNVCQKLDSNFKCRSNCMHICSPTAHTTKSQQVATAVEVVSPLEIVQGAVQPATTTAMCLQDKKLCQGPTVLNSVHLVTIGKRVPATLSSL